MNITNKWLNIAILVDGGLTDWSIWDTCSVTCGGGKQGRTRSCTIPAPQIGGALCLGDLSSEQVCNTQECPSELMLT